MLQRFWVSRKNYVTITGKVGAQTKFKSVGAVAKFIFLIIWLLTALFIFYFYVLLFYASVIKAFGANYNLTLEHYKVIFAEGLPAIKDTLIIAVSGMLIGGLYGVLVGYLTAKKKFLSRQLMEIMAMVNYSLPGTIVE